jgi:hypothetical protein
MKAVEAEPNLSNVAVLFSSNSSGHSHGSEPSRLTYAHLGRRISLNDELGHLGGLLNSNNAKKISYVSK